MNHQSLRAHMRRLPIGITAAFATTAVLPLAVGAQEATEAPRLQTVVVTGTRALNRTVSTSESPIDVLSAKDLQSTGSGELATVLSRLVPSFNFARPAVTDASDAVRPAQLRGLSPDQTLVLVDGKRRHTTAVVNVNGTVGRGSSPVDLNTIPIDAIDHVEVLRDGAAAQYGSDAIAGVINIILKKGAKGGVARLDVGHYKHDGAQHTAAVSAGLALNDNGFVRLTVEDRAQNATNRAGADFRDPTEPRYGQVNQRFGDADSHQHSLLVNGQLSLTDDATLYATGAWSRRRSSAAATWRTAQTAVGSGVLRTPLYPQGFLPIENSASTDGSVVVGVRGDDFHGWRWDVSVNHGANVFDIDVDHTVNLSLGATSPTSFHAGRLKNAETVVNVDLSRDIALGLPNPVTVAAGAEWRRDTYGIDAGTPDSYAGSGAQGFAGFQPQNAGHSSRTSEAVYLNLETEFSKQWSGAAAVRSEHYSDFGNATSAKLSGRFAPTENVALRATASTGFRAPSLAQQHYTTTTTNFIVINGVNTPIDTGTFAVGSAAAQALGATPLKAEKSRNVSLGIVLTPSKNLTATVDLYQIDIDHRVLFSSNVVLPSALQAELAANGVLAGAARYFTNAIDTRTRGVDAVGTYRVELASWGRVDLSAGYNRNKNSVRSVAANPAVLARNNLTLIDAQTLGRSTVSSPDSKTTLGADYAIGRWTVRSNATRYGKYIVPQNNATLNQTFDPAWVLDLSGSVKLNGWTLAAGADNVNNRYPQQVTSAGNLSTNGIFRYSSFSPFGFNGRLYYAKASYAW